MYRKLCEILYVSSKKIFNYTIKIRHFTHSYNIETGGFRGTQLDDRIFQLCDTQEVEDEIHFVCICNLYNDLRKIIYRIVEHKHSDFYMYDNKDKFIFLVQKEWKILGNYLVETWSEHTHTQIIYLVWSCWFLI